MHINLPVWVIVLALIAGFAVGVGFGWNNGKKSIIAKIESEAQTLVGDALRHVSAFWTKLKRKL